MAVAWFRNPILDQSADVIDRDSVNERRFGVTKAKRHPNYVFSVNKNACLMHKIADITIHHYAIVNLHQLGRLKQPAMIANTVCGASFALTPDRSRTCAVPLPDAVLCGRCHGQLATFRREVATKAAKISARVKLGCEVAGYPSSLDESDSGNTVSKAERADSARRSEAPKKSFNDGAA